MAAVGTPAYGSTSASAGVPSGVTSGSLLVAVTAAVWNQDGTTPTSTKLTAPSGWTQAGFLGYAYTSSGESFAMALFYKYATGADTGTYSFGTASVGGQSAYHMHAIVQRIANGPTSGNPFDGTPVTQVGVSGGGTWTATGVTMPSFSVTSNNSLLIGGSFASWYNSWATPIGWTLDGQAPSSDFTSMAAYHRAIQAGTAPATTFYESGTGGGYFGIIIKPAS